jgi:transposase
MTTPDAKQVAREARTMTVTEVLRKADEGVIKWVQAAEILNVTPRHLLRLRERFIKFGMDGLKDGRKGRPMPRRVSEAEVTRICDLKTSLYAEYTTRHFHEMLGRKHDVKVSYSWVRNILQAKGLMVKAPGRGKHRRHRERRPMTGMLLHIDGSTHEWISGLPKQDLIVMLDDADGQILFARFFEQEGTLSTMAALEHVLQKHGRFSELYTDRGSHFCRTSQAGDAPDEVQNGQVARVLKTLGINHIRARSPQARGRSERAFRTLQDRLPKELRTEGIETYEGANRFLETTYIKDYNKAFAVKPTQKETAFTPMLGVNFGLLFSAQYKRTVRPDNVVSFEGTQLQLPKTRRASLARCEVIVHVLTTGHYAVTYLGEEVARFNRDGTELKNPKARRAA